MQRTGKFYWLTVIAYTCLVMGLVFIFLFSGLVVNSLVGIIIGMCICGFSNGIGVTSTLIGLSKYLPSSSLYRFRPPLSRPLFPPNLPSPPSPALSHYCKHIASKPPTNPRSRKRHPRRPSRSNSLLLPLPQSGLRIRRLHVRHRRKPKPALLARRIPKLGFCGCGNRG